MWWQNLKKLIIANPMGLFIYGIIAKWYIMILIPSVIVLYFTFKGLESAGVFKKAEDAFALAMNNVKGVAKNCTPLIMDLKHFWVCLNRNFDNDVEEDNPDAKNLEGVGKGLQQEVKRITDPKTSDSQEFLDNPYE